MSTKALPFVGMHQLDSQTSVTNNALGSNDSLDYEKEEHPELALVLHDPSTTQLDMHSDREDSADRIQDAQEEAFARTKYVAAKAYRSRKLRRSKRQAATHASSLENHAPTGVLNRVQQSMQHLHNLAEGKYDRSRDHLFGKSVEQAELDALKHQTLTRISMLQPQHSLHAYTKALTASAEKLPQASVANKTMKEPQKAGQTFLNKDTIDKTRLRRERRDKVLETQFESGNRTLGRALESQVQRGVSPINFRHAHGGVVLGSHDNGSIMASEK